MKTAIIMFGFAAFLYAMGSWLQLVALLGGGFEDAIRIPAMAAMIAGVVWWPFFIRSKLRERATHSAKSDPGKGQAPETP